MLSLFWNQFKITIIKYILSLDTSNKLDTPEHEIVNQLTNQIPSKKNAHKPVKRDTSSSQIIRVPKTIKQQ